MHALTLALALLAPSQQWTVDNGAPADFAEIADAVASPQVADGDTLLVRHGSYAGFVLDRDLSIIGQAGALFSVPSVTVDGAHEVTIAGLSTRSLTLANITGRATLDECAVGWWELKPNAGFLVWQGECRVEFCADVVVQRSTLHGSEGCYPELGTTRAALTALGSSIALVDCTLVGGDDDICSGHPTEGAKPAVELDACFATLSGCTLLGGDDVQVGAAPAVRALDSDVRLRGSSGHLVRGGRLLAGGYAPALAGSSSSATISGVRYDPTTLPAWVREPPIADPYLRLVGSAAPGSTLQVEVYGTAGLATQAIWGDIPRLFFLYLGLDPLWFRRVSILGKLALVTLGQDVPASFAYSVPTGGAGAGRVTVFQAWLPQLFGSTGGFLSSPAVLVQRW